MVDNVVLGADYPPAEVAVVLILAVAEAGLVLLPSTDHLSVWPQVEVAVAASDITTIKIQESLVE
jgi:hypothetical protein